MNPSINESINQIVAGTYGGCNSVFYALAELRAGNDLKEFHKKRSADEYYNPGLHKLFTEHRDAISTNWDKINTLDPLGMFATPPTQSATEACMDIPELKANLALRADGKIVNKDGTINVVKCAVDYVWNVPKLAKAVKLDEKKMRSNIFKYTQNKTILNEKLNCYLPPCAGATVYFFGDPAKLAEENVEVAVRVHDSCGGSDVFGTDICTCRPYLIFGINAAVECAQRGGVGLIVYFQKEGRSLGEVTKFRVYNARKKQKGGDTAEKYFYQTESIAGIRDARFQEMMPDILLWLGVKHISYLCSMSSEKYDAITNVGITVAQRVALPDTYVPKNAHVEINAKVASGYHSDSVDSKGIVANLKQLSSIRERCSLVYDLAKKGETRHFTLHPEKMGDVVDRVIAETKRAYPQLQVPYHSRWRHFDVKDVDSLVSGWPCDKLEKVRRQLDLSTISVLLDAGAGKEWHYIDSHSKNINRSEGIAIATFDMFKYGLFSSDVASPHRVNAHGLKNIKFKDFCRGFQLSEHNPMIGAKGRFGLMARLGDALRLHPKYFGAEVARPGNILDYVLKHTKDNKVSIKVLWDAIINGFESIWPQTLSGVRRGDVWVYTPLKVIGKPASDFVPFHKLSQWLAYSLLEPIESLGIKFTDMNLMTGLAEYRNGGLFVDCGVLELKKPSISKKAQSPGSELIVEWRALTVCLLDEVAVQVQKKLNLTPEQFPLAKVLQGGTWACGRIAAKEKRPDATPPIRILSQGTVFSSEMKNSPLFSFLFTTFLTCFAPFARERLDDSTRAAAFVVCSFCVSCVCCCWFCFK
jgi:GTP cyclohydrolase II